MPTIHIRIDDTSYSTVDDDQTAAALLRRAGLTRLNHPAFDQPEVERASLDGFVLAVMRLEDPTRHIDHRGDQPSY